MLVTRGVTVAVTVGVTVNSYRPPALSACSICPFGFAVDEGRERPSPSHKRTMCYLGFVAARASWEGANVDSLQQRVRMGAWNKGISCNIASFWFSSTRYKSVALACSPHCQFGGPHRAAAIANNACAYVVESFCDHNRAREILEPGCHGADCGNSVYSRSDHFYYCRLRPLKKAHLYEHRNPQTRVLCNEHHRAARKCIGARRRTRGFICLGPAWSVATERDSSSKPRAHGLRTL
jgi:hypothetical protein